MKIKWLHVELSSKCNAWCPACPRNNNGYEIVDGLVEQDLPTSRFIEVLDQLPDITAVQLCGNYGDPVIANNILEVIAICKEKNLQMQIHTNGSLRTTKWWKQLGETLLGTNHNIWFGIDGLDGVHEIYRQGTSYQKIINNAEAFINAGGNATWQFIPYAHNEHQIKDCIRTSQKLKFKQFKLVKLYRNKKLARHYRTGEEFSLLPPKEFQHLIRIPKTNTNVDPKNCMHMSLPSIYLSANGKLARCCYLASTELFDTVDELIYNELDLNKDQCLNSCGT